MIHQVGSTNMLPGKEKEAEQLLLKFAALVNQLNPGANAHVLRNLDGKRNQIHLIDTWDSVGVWEGARDKIESDPAFQTLMQEAAAVFDWNSLERHFYQIVSDT